MLVLLNVGCAPSKLCTPEAGAFSVNHFLKRLHGQHMSVSWEKKKGFLRRKILMQYVFLTSVQGHSEAE